MNARKIFKGSGEPVARFEGSRGKKKKVVLLLLFIDDDDDDDESVVVVVVVGSRDDGFVNSLFNASAEEGSR